MGILYMDIQVLISAQVPFLLFHFTFIRNIYGEYKSSNDFPYIPPTNYIGSGCIQATILNDIFYKSEIIGEAENKAQGFIFNANDTKEGKINPMYGHAGGSEIKPYTILAVPIYIY